MTCRLCMILITNWNDCHTVAVQSEINQRTRWLQVICFRLRNPLLIPTVSEPSQFLVYSSESEITSMHLDGSSPSLAVRRIVANGTRGMDIDYLSDSLLYSQSYPGSLREVSWTDNSPPIQLLADADGELSWFTNESLIFMLKLSFST